MLKRSNPYLALFLLSLGACSDPSVAEIGGRSISVSDFKRQLRIYQSIRPEQVVNDELRRQVLEQVIRQELLADEARSLGLDKDPRFKETVAKRVAQLRLELKTAIENAQTQTEGLERAVETKALIDALVQARQGAITITAKELRETFAKQKLANGAQETRSFEQVRDSLMQQMILEKLVAEAGKRVPVAVHVEAALAR